jgi:hypothetical protein
LDLPFGELKMSLKELREEVGYDAYNGRFVSSAELLKDYEILHSEPWQHKTSMATKRMHVLHNNKSVTGTFIVRLHPSTAISIGFQFNIVKQMNVSKLMLTSKL